MAEFKKQSPCSESSRQLTENPNPYFSISCKRAKLRFTPHGFPSAPRGAEMPGLLPESLRGATLLPGRSCLSSHHALCLQIPGPPTQSPRNTHIHIVTQKIWAQFHKSTQTLLLYTQTHPAHNTFTGASTGPHTRCTNTEA